MTTPQDPPVRRRQKKRRTKQLAQWRAKHPKEASPAADAKVTDKKAEKAPAKPKKAAAAK